MTPESLTARIRGLNELTNNLNAYLKEYCAMEDFEKLKQELEASKDELGGDHLDHSVGLYYSCKSISVAFRRGIAHN